MGLNSGKATDLFIFNLEGDTIGTVNTPNYLFLYKEVCSGSCRLNNTAHVSERERGGCSGGSHAHVLHSRSP